MATAPSPGSVNFGTIVAPDVAAEQMALVRRQQMVDLLRQQAVTPTEQQTAGGMAVPISPMNGLAKMAAAYLAGKRQTDIDSKTLDLNKQMAQRYAQILGGGASATDAATAAPVALAQGAAQGSVGPTAANAQRMDTLTTPQSGQPGGDSFGMSNLLRGSVVGQLGGDSAASAYWDRFKLPEGVKTADLYGVPRSEMAAALRREQAAKGQMMVREGSTVTQTQPDGSMTPMFTAPDLKQGANITWKGGAPVADPIQGLQQINADMAGAQTQAQETAKAGLDMVTVNTPQGPRMMTRAQAVALSGAPAAGGAPIAPPAQPGMPPAGPVPAPAGPMPTAPVARPANPMASQPGDSDKPMIYAQELAKERDKLANPAKYMSAAELQADPDMSQFKARTQANLDGIGREAKAAGIPLQTEGQQKFEQTMGSNQANLLDDGYKKAKIAADDLMGIDQSRKALQGGTFVGSTAEAKLSIAKFINANIPGVNITPEKVTNTDYLKSTLGKGLLEQAKTLGSNPSNADATRINDIVGSIGKDPQALARILDWRQQMSERAIQMHNANVGQAVKNGFQPQFDMTVKSPVNSTEIDSLMQKYGGR